MVRYSKALKQYINDTVNDIKNRLYLQVYDITIKYKDYRDGELDATIHVDTEYLRATITIYPFVNNYWKKKNKQEIKHLLLHECCHILLLTLKNGEPSVCWLAKILEDK